MQLKNIIGMILINSTQISPYFNIAAEEYVLKNFKEDVIILWQSTPSVIVGKHQNMVAEVNLKYTREQEIPVIRRISGGGTVYHDLGNLNYTLIRNEENHERLIDFKRFSMPVMEFIKTLGIEASFEGKNNLVINGKKFSGNSAHVFKNRVMHHGTLLFNTNLARLEKVIRPSIAQISDKSVKSIRAEVINLSDALNYYLSMDEFRQNLTEYLKNHYGIQRVYKFKEKDKTAINTLIDEKYAVAKWNYGYSPAYEFENKIEGYHLFIKVKNGIIEQIELKGIGKQIVNKFKGVMHRNEDIALLAEKVSRDENQKQLLLSLFGF